MRALDSSIWGGEDTTTVPLALTVGEELDQHFGPWDAAILREHYAGVMLTAIILGLPLIAGCAARAAAHWARIEGRLQ